MHQEKTKDIMKLLENKNYVTAKNNWYAPSREFHEKHSSIKRMVLMDTTSSAGDWSGFFIQKTGKRSAVAIPFCQENNYPHDGFTFYTGTAFMKGDCSEDFYNCACEEWRKRTQSGYWDC